jgi:hypothetical protein
VTRREALRELTEWIATAAILLIGLALLAVFLQEEPHPGPPEISVVVVRPDAPDIGTCPWIWPGRPADRAALP